MPVLQTTKTNDSPAGAPGPQRQRLGGAQVPALQRLGGAQVPALQRLGGARRRACNVAPHRPCRALISSGVQTPISA
jgi:hypothetical protein